jgi:hypothetical protein
MKVRVALLLALLLNCVLAWLLLRTHSKPLAARMPSSTVQIPASNSAPAKVIRLDWRSVESPDYREYIRNLRTIGCPEETIFDIIVADVNTLFALRSRSLVGTNAWKYWEGGNPMPSRDELRNQKLRRELEKQKLALIREILGPDAIERLRKYQLWGDEELAGRKLAFLSEEKRNKVKHLQEKFYDLRQDATEYDSRGVLTEQSAKQIVDLERRLRAELEAALSPEELTEYDLRNSELAAQLQADLNGFHPSEEEFRKLYQFRKETDAVLNSATDVRDPTLFQARNSALQDVEDRTRGALGADRYADFQRARDLDYQNVLRLTQFFDLPESTANAVYEFKRLNDAQAAETAKLPPEKIDAAYAQLQFGAETTLAKLLGERAFAEYRQNNRWWLRNQ